MNQHLPADDKPKADQIVANLEAFVKDLDAQVTEKQDELDKLNNANDALKRLGDALDDAEKSVVPNNVAALNEFKERIAPHLTTLVEAVQEVPASVEPTAAALRELAAKFVADLDKNIRKTGDDEKRAEDLKNQVGEAVKNVDEVVPKYQQPQPLDIAKQNAVKLKNAFDQMTNSSHHGVLRSWPKVSSMRISRIVLIVVFFQVIVPGVRSYPTMTCEWKPSVTCGGLLVPCWGHGMRFGESARDLEHQIVLEPYIVGDIWRTFGKIIKSPIKRYDGTCATHNEFSGIWLCCSDDSQSNVKESEEAEGSTHEEM